MNRLYNIVLASLVALGGLWSCAVEDMPMEEVKGGIDSDIINISTQITDCSDPLVKNPQLGEDGSGNFSKRDRISLFITPEGGQSAISSVLTLGSEGWTPQLKWSEIGATMADFNAFYPVINGAEGEYMHSISENQSDATEYRVSDLLSAHVTASKGEPVNLNFTHLMSRVKVVLSAAGETTPEDLASAVVRVKSSAAVTVDLIDLTLGQASENQVNVVAMRSGDVFRAVVAPQELTKEWKETSWIEVEVGGKTYDFQAPSTLGSQSFTRLEPGKEVTINLTLNRKPVVPEPEPEPQPEDFAGKTVWVKGLKNIPDPSTWKKIETVPAPRYGLKWDASYGWYDCKKIYPNGKSYGPVQEGLSGGDDKNLCWAATAANMIYWWLDTNKDYIERYGKYTGPKNYGSDSDAGDKEWQKHFHAGIFDFFKDNFGNDGYDVNGVLNWFFTGRGANDLGVSASKASFFKDILGSGAIASELYGVDGGRFTQVVKDALAAGKVIGFNHTFPNRTLHAINLWGATFDESGEITHIYVTDSNNGQYAGPSQFEGEILTRAGLEKRAVKVIDGDTCMESSSPGKFSLPIVNVYTIDPMKDKWEAYFRTH